MIKVAITDDHPLLVNGIRNILKTVDDISFVASFVNGQKTLDEIEKHNPDILLLDINLPDIDGLKLCRLLLEQNKKVKIIGLTSHKEIAFLKSLMKSGAKGYLLKNTPVCDIVDAIRKVHAGEDFIQQEMKELLLAESLQKAPKIGVVPKLTRRENEILKLISEELTTQEIADQLYLSPKTVESHRQNLLLKLGAKNSVGLVKSAMEKGLL